MTLTRRAALALSAAAAAGPALAARKDRDPIAGWTVVNSLGGFDDLNAPAEGPLVITPRMLADAKASGLTAINCTLGYVFGPEAPYETTLADVRHYDELIAAHPRDLMKVTTAADIARAKATGRIGLIYGFQNAAMMGDDARRVDTFADMGVRVIQLTYNNANQLGDGSMAPQGRGLTPFGHEVVERLNARRVIVDLAHSGTQICLDAARASKQPIAITHTGCRALTDLPRNKTDEELRLVAERGGYVGIYFMPFLNASGHGTAADVVAHIQHALKVCGEDHVGLGTDGGTTQVDDMKAYRLAAAKEHADRVAKGIAATGERADNFPFIEDLQGPGQFRKMERLLAARGLKPRVIEKVFGANFVRYARDVWGA